MKALILAAGMGTRLLPFTAKTPKPLFPVGGRPLLDIIIDNLQQVGCRSIIINTHHLHRQIDDFIASRQYPIPVHTRYEPVILGTGGAIKNVADFWDTEPFIVLNSDIIFDIDLKKVYDFHLKHSPAATLVLHDDPLFNSVTVDGNGFVAGFHHQSTTAGPQKRKLQGRPLDIKKEPSYPPSGPLTFTGIQVLDPQILEYIPDNVFSSSIDAFEKLISENKKIAALISKQAYWKDIGTPQRYQEAVFDHMTPQAFQRTFAEDLSGAIACNPIKGDGSDRQWYRLSSGRRTLIMVNHGIRQTAAVNQTDAFVSIGRHLFSRGLPVPEIYMEDTFAGLVFVEDLGDTNLQDIVRNTQSAHEIAACYRSVIDLLIKLSVEGARGFDVSWTYQTERYDRRLILEKECRYFVDAFLCGYLDTNFYFDDFKEDFSCLADRALEFGHNGFMHRDMQSRNIMVKDHRFYFIDFQGGRLGPLQYDLASLLIDPYVDLPYPLQKKLLDYGIARLMALIKIDPADFRRGYNYCAITRNLQILGAFGYLSRVAGKTYFEKYIPPAITALKRNLAMVKDNEFPTLKSLCENLSAL